MMKKRSFLFSFPFLLLLACEKEPGPPDSSSILFRIEHQVDGEALKVGNTEYVNEAGNRYRVEKLEYFLSDPKLISERGKTVKADTVYYLNPSEGKGGFRIEGVPPGRYLRFRCVFGIPKEKNHHHMHQHRSSFGPMRWPEQMGGGYHFMRFEGHYRDSGNWKGFALHLGKNSHQVRIDERIDVKFRAREEELVLSMNVNELFKGACGTYDLTQEPSHSMTHEDAMDCLSRNGKGLFHIQR